eukprot:11559880-Alexandrium_andersonii.AAC.1
MSCLHGELGCIAQIVAGADEDAPTDGNANQAVCKAGLRGRFARLLSGLGALASATGAPAPSGGDQNQ